MKSIYIAPFIYYVYLKALRHGSHSFTCKLHHACLSFVSVHQMEPPLTEVRDIQLQLTTHLSTPKAWKAELAWFVDLQRTVYPHKWSPLSYRSSAGQEKFAGKRLTFYRCAMKTNKVDAGLYGAFTKHFTGPGRATGCVCVCVYIWKKSFE